MSFEIPKNENSFEGEGFEIKNICEFKLTKLEQFKIFEGDDFTIKKESILGELNESTFSIDLLNKEFLGDDCGKKFDEIKMLEQNLELKFYGVCAFQNGFFRIPNLRSYLKANNNYYNEFSLKNEKQRQKKERQKQKEDSKNICFFIKNKKIGYNMKTNTSSRYDNQMNKIISHLIQNIFLEWINNGETDESKLLRKIDAEVLKEKNYNFKGNTLKEIYSELKSKKKTSVKKQKDFEHNKEVIANCKDEIKKKKLEMKFEQALYYFLCKKDGSTNKNINNLDENEDNILEGLIRKEAYLNRIEGDASYKKQLLKILEKIKKKYIPNLI